MNYETVPAHIFGASLTGLGINLLCQDVRKSAAFLDAVFGMGIHRLSADFAIVTYGKDVFMLHVDGTYHSHPLLSLLPENPPRGPGIELHLYETDPDQAVELARAHGGSVLAPPKNKPHGLREAFILDLDGYCWVPSRRL